MRHRSADIFPDHVASLKAQGVEVELICIGTKGSTYFKRRETKVRESYLCGQSPTAKQAQEIAEEVQGCEIERIGGYLLQCFIWNLPYISYCDFYEHL